MFIFQVVAFLNHMPCYWNLRWVLEQNTNMHICKWICNCMCIWNCMCVYNCMHIYVWGGPVTDCRRLVQLTTDVSLLLLLLQNPTSKYTQWREVPPNREVGGESLISAFLQYMDPIPATRWINLLSSMQSYHCNALWVSSSPKAL